MHNTIYTAQMLIAQTMVIILMWAIVGFETMAIWYGIYHLLWHTWNTLTVFHKVGKEAEAQEALDRVMDKNPRNTP